MKKILALILCILEYGYVENRYDVRNKSKCNDINLIILRVTGELGEVDYTCKEFKIHQSCLKEDNIDIKSANYPSNWDVASAYEYLEKLCHKGKVTATDVQRETETKIVGKGSKPTNGTRFGDTKAKFRKDYGEGDRCVVEVLRSSVRLCMSESKYKADEDFSLLRPKLREEDRAKVEECMLSGYNALCHVSRIQEFCGRKSVGEGENVVEIFRRVRKRCQ